MVIKISHTLIIHSKELVSFKFIHAHKHRNLSLQFNFESQLVRQFDSTVHSTTNQSTIPQLLPLIFRLRKATLSQGLLSLSERRTSSFHYLHTHLARVTQTFYLLLKYISHQLLCGTNLMSWSPFWQMHLSSSNMFFLPNWNISVEGC